MFKKTDKNFSIIPVCVATIVCIIIVGFFLNKIVVGYGIRLEEKGLLQYSLAAASSFSPEIVTSLKDKPTDIDSSDFQAIRSQLLRIKNANRDIRFIYLMALNNDKVIFLVDAEPPISDDYSAPGSIYDDASPELFEIFLNAKPFVEGPLEDDWGVWVSGFAPIFDQQGKTIIAVIGTDIDARTWHQNINVYRWFSYTITGLLIFVVLVYFSFLYKISSANKNLNTEIKERELIEKRLFKEKEKAQKYLNIAGVIFVVIDINQTVTLINQKGCQVLKSDEQTILGKNWFDTFIPQNEREQTRAAFYEIISGNKEPVEYFENSVLSKDGQLKYIAWHNTVLRNEQEKIIASLSSGEDITARKMAEQEREELIKKLQEALENVKTLSGLFPICSHCKKIRDDKGYWNQIETHIAEHSDAQFSHSMCPECSDKLYGAEEWYIKMKKEI